MTSHHRTKAEIVNLLQYRRDRSQQRLDFSDRFARQPALTLVRPFRALSAREVAHRERMVQFMGKAKRSSASR